MIKLFKPVDEAQCCGVLVWGQGNGVGKVQHDCLLRDTRSTDMHSGDTSRIQVRILRYYISGGGMVKKKKKPHLQGLIPGQSPGYIGQGRNGREKKKP